MKNSSLTAIIVLLFVVMFLATYNTDRAMKAKDKRIKELEFQVWSLKLDKRLDSISDHYVDAFKRKMDSIAGHD